MTKLLGICVAMVTLSAACGGDGTTTEPATDSTAPESTIAETTTTTTPPTTTTTTTPPTTTTTTTTTTPIEKIIDACSVSCRAEPVPQAAAFQGAGPHPVVLLGAEGQEHPWSNDLPAAWRPPTVNDVQLVTVVGPEQEIVIEVCPYTPPPNITRYRYQTDIRLVEASTGVTLVSTVLVGADPRDCRQQEAMSLTRLDGEPVTAQQVEDWLRPVVSEAVL